MRRGAVRRSRSRENLLLFRGSGEKSAYLCNFSKAALLQHKSRVKADWDTEKWPSYLLLPL